MARRRLAGLVSLALMVAGGLIAHDLAYRIVASRTDPTHHGAPADDVHGYLGFLPMCFAVCGAVVVVGLVALVLTRLRSPATVTPPLWLFGVVPPFGFAVQEHLERLAATGVFPYAAALETTFVVGVVLQLPFAVAAYVAARALIALAVAVVKRRRSSTRRYRLARQPAPPRAVWLPVPAASALGLGHGERAPPPCPV